MASSRILISSQTLTGSQASVTFSSIPSTYTDLLVSYSIRRDTTANGFNLRFNGDTGSATTYSRITLRGDGSAASSDSQASDSATVTAGGTVQSTYTANTFSSGEIYIPSYTVSQNKPLGIYTVAENNATAALYINALASLYRNTATINAIEFSSSGNFVSGSSFYLYGLKNS